MKKRNNFTIAIILLYISIVGTCIIDIFVLKNIDYKLIGIVVVSIVIGVLMYLSANKYHNSVKDNISSQINDSIEETFKQKDFGMIIYNDEYEITWLSDLFSRVGIEKEGERILSWLPELQDVLSSKVEKTIIIINDNKYEVSKKDGANVLYFEDISKEYDLKRMVDNQAYVLGIINFDNFDDLNLNDDEISYVNTRIKVPVLEYLKNYGIVYKTLRNNRLQLVLNNQIYKKLVEDRFSILNKVRRLSKEGNIDITLSMAFAYGSNNLEELDEDANNLLEIAETRGGDQVVVRQFGKEVVYYGGSTEAKERQSKVKVRVIASTIKRLIEESSNVIIVGHKDADADCVGSALAMSLISSLLGKDVYIAIKNNEVEKMIGDVLIKYSDTLKVRHNFVSEDEAIDLLDEKTLVIMVDHHSKVNSNSQELLEKAKNIMILDHHRRKIDLDVETQFVYVEAGASSSTELAVELFPYFSKSIDVFKEEANIMYIGLLIDTNHFRNRSDARTFDAAKTLKQYGADSIICEELIEEPYEMTKKRYEILSEAKRYKDNIMIANLAEKVYPRSIASQAVDYLVEIKEIDAAFVLYRTNSNEYAVSARSDGTINVQLILEKLGGGGHMTAAGIQTKDKDGKQLYEELIQAIDEYIESVNNNESNIVE